jgi:hypothetical protein
MRSAPSTAWGLQSAKAGLGGVDPCPDRRKPRPQGQLGVLKDRADLDRKITPAGVALVLVGRDASRGHALDLALVGTAAQRAEQALAEPDRRQVIDSRLFGRKRREKLRKGFEGLDHGSAPDRAFMPQSFGWVKHVYKSP